MIFNYDYTQCMVTKLLMAVPDRKGGSSVYCNCDKALDIIRETDNMTKGIKKIVYLVGWQYNGHDDKYPAFFQVNEGIKGGREKTALESLLYLMREAKKYNTIVSVHINLTDAYRDSPLFDGYVKAGALIRTRGGRPAAIEKYNGKKCYKISSKEEWESGLFRARCEKLFSVLPLKEQGTVHVDNFQCYVNRAPYISAEEQIYYRDLMIDYFAQNGIDITTEFTYREGKGSALLYGKVTRDITPRRYPIALLGKVGANWWVDKMSLEEYYKYYPHSIGGGVPKYKRAAQLFYGNIHCEEIWKKPDWHAEFLKEFCLVQLPHFYLNGKTRQGFTDRTRRAVKYSDGSVSRADGTIICGGEKVKDKNDVFLPFREGFCAYSLHGAEICGYIGANSAEIFRITAYGDEYIGLAKAKNGVISFDVPQGTAYYIQPIN